MVKNRKGGYSKSGEYMEVRVKSSSSYEEVTEVCQRVLELPGSSTGILTLFRVDGTIVPSQGFGTLKSYFLGVKKTAAQLKFGVGYTTKQKLKQSAVESKLYKSKSNHEKNRLPYENSVKVLYAADLNMQGLDVTNKKDRIGVYKTIHMIDDSSDDDGDMAMDEGYIFLPESHDWCVCEVVVDDKLLLFYDDGNKSFQVANDDGGVLKIIHQPQRSIQLEKDAIFPLYCIASGHSPSLKYRWESTTGVLHGNTPVMWCQSPGVYHCTVISGADRCFSASIEVSEAIQSKSKEAFIDLSGTASTESDSTSVDTGGSKKAKVELESDDDFVSVKVKKRKGHKRPVTIERASRRPLPNLSIPSGCMQFSSAELCDSTHNYSRSTIVGRGGFGVIHKAVLRGTLKVAIKRLNQAGKDALLKTKPEKMLETEISTLTRFRHPNIVPLCGYCLKPPSLVYEYMDNGCLYKCLHETEDFKLGWPRKEKILNDALKGLVYLHQADPPLVHHDIKSANILIDSLWNGRLSDFGFAVEVERVCQGYTMYSSNKLIGSEGYYAPEISAGKFSDRSDVFSYGVVVLETFVGLKAFDSDRPDQKLMEHLQDELKSYDGLLSVADKRLSTPPDKLARRIYEIICSCTRKHSTRPSSQEVLNMWKEAEDDND